MATILTTSQTDILSPPTQAPIARDNSTNATLTGRLYAVVRTATDTLSVYRSLDGGGSWASWSSFTHTGLQEWSRFQLDRNGYGHLAYRLGTGTADTLWYRRVSLSSGSWSGQLQVSGTDANSGSIGSRWQGVDLAVVRHSDGAYAIAVVAAHTEGTTRYGVWAHGVSISKTGSIYLNNGIIVNNRSWLTTGTAPGRSGVTCELEHTGDGFSASTPHLWITWGRTTLRMVKLAWQGTTVGWSGPANSQVIRASIPAQDYAAGRWDGKQWVMAAISPDDSTMVRIFQRNQANTITASFDTPAHPQGAVRNVATSYDNTTKDIRVYAVGTSTAQLYFIDFTRGSSTWSTWATVSATAVLGAAGQEWGVRAGGSSGNSRMDVVTAHSGAPNTVVHTAQTVSSTPATATWDTSSVPYYNGGAADVATTLTLDWNFSDPDPGQGQGSFALSRQIGAGTVNYWNVATQTWGVTEVQNGSATTSVVLPVAWGAGTDASHIYKVKVWDSSGTPAAAYSAQMVIVPSVKVNPVIVTPTAAQVLNTDQVTMTWTAAEQTARRIRLLTNPGGQVVYDPGYVATTDLSFTVPNRLANGTGWTIELTTKNAEGLASTAQTRNFTVAYAPPPAMISTFTPSALTGLLTVTPSSLAPVGVQPAIVYADLYRRPVAGPTLNSNPTFAGNVTSYVAGGAAGATVSYSTAQAHEGAGSGKLTPNGVGAVPSIESSPTVLIPDVTQSYVASAWVRPDTGNKPIFIQLNWYTSAISYISSTTLTVSAPVAGAWQYLEVVGQPSNIPGAARVTMGIGLSNTPAATDVIYVDEARLRLYNPSDGVRVAAANGATTPVGDWGAASGVDYEYRWVATGANGTTIYSPWTS